MAGWSFNGAAHLSARNLVFFDADLWLLRTFNGAAHLSARNSPPPILMPVTGDAPSTEPRI